ncbi:MAG: hypothetical protein DRP63_05990 [Planctomycetota bacterium]|nr:MAG: hypothetical protein DRP63_05990 [Planctomycetota bacterium]
MLKGNCFEDQTLSRYIDGRLPEQDARRLRAHLEVCSVCRKRLQLLSMPKRVLTRLPEQRPTLSFSSVLNAYKRRLRLMRLLRRAVVWSSAAAVVLIAVILLLPETPSPSPHRKATPHRKVAVEVPAPSRKLPEPRAAQKQPQPKVVKRQPKHPTYKPPPQKHSEAPHEQVVKVEPPRKEQRRVSVRSTPVVERTPLLFEDVIAQFNRARQEKDTGGQAEAVRTMGKIGTPQAEAFLCRLALDEHELAELRAQATLALGEIGTRKAAETILAVARSDKERLSAAAVKALGRIRVAQTLQWLLTHVLPKSRHEAERLAVARSLCCVNPLPARKVIWAVKQERSAAVKLAVAFSIAKRRDKVALQVLQELVKDGNFTIRRACVELLGMFGKNAVKVLSRIARNESNPLLRELALKSLLATDTKEGALAALKFLKSSDRRAYGVVLKGLIDLTGRRFTTERAWRRYIRRLPTFPPEKSRTTDIGYNADFSIWNIPFWTRSVVFVVDCSTTARRIKALNSAIDVVMQTVRNIPDYVRVNVVCYGSTLLTYSHKGLVPAVKVRRGLERFLKAQLARNIPGADLYSALITAIKLAPDDIVLLTTGVTSRHCFSNLSSLVDAVSRANQKVGCRIHILAFFATNRKNTENLIPCGETVEALKRLAMLNLGQFRYRWLKQTH